MSNTRGVVDLTCMIDFIKHQRVPLLPITCCTLASNINIAPKAENAMILIDCVKYLMSRLLSITRSGAGTMSTFYRQHLVITSTKIKAHGGFSFWAKLVINDLRKNICFNRLDSNKRSCKVLNIGYFCVFK